MKLTPIVVCEPNTVNISYTLQHNITWLWYTNSKVAPGIMFSFQPHTT